MDTKIDDVTLQASEVIPETIKTIQYDINHLIEEKNRLNARISEIDALLLRASNVGVDLAVSAVSDMAIKS